MASRGEGVLFLGGQPAPAERAGTSTDQAKHVQTNEKPRWPQYRASVNDVERTDGATYIRRTRPALTTTHVGVARLRVATTLAASGEQRTGQRVIVGAASLPVRARVSAEGRRQVPATATLPVYTRATFDGRRAPGGTQVALRVAVTLVATPRAAVGVEGAATLRTRADVVATGRRIAVASAALTTRVRITARPAQRVDGTAALTATVRIPKAAPIPTRTAAARLRSRTTVRAVGRQHHRATARPLQAYVTVPVARAAEVGSAHLTVGVSISDQPRARLRLSVRLVADAERLAAGNRARLRSQVRLVSAGGRVRRVGKASVRTGVTVQATGQVVVPLDAHLETHVALNADGLGGVTQAALGTASLAVDLDLRAAGSVVVGGAASLQATVHLTASGRDAPPRAALRTKVRLTARAAHRPATRRRPTTSAELALTATSARALALSTR